MSENAQTEMTITKSTKALLKAIQDCNKVTAELASMENTVEQLSTDIQYKQAEIDALNEQQVLNVRKADAELELQILENEQKVLSGLLDKNGLAHISKEDVTTMRDQIENLSDDNQSEIAAAVKSAVNRIETAHSAETTKIIAAHEVATAELKAQITSLTAQVTNQRENITSLNEIIKEERTARVEMARAATPNIVQAAAQSSK